MRTIKYSFPEEFLRYKIVRTSLSFTVGPQARAAPASPHRPPLRHAGCLLQSARQRAHLARELSAAHMRSR